MDNKKDIRQDINFLEYPRWVVNSRSTATSLHIENDRGTFDILSPKGIPTHFDNLILYYLLHMSWKNDAFS